MKSEAVLKSINAALSCISTAKEFARHDYMEDSTQQELGEAAGYLEGAKLYLEIELGKPFADEAKRPTVQ